MKINKPPVAQGSSLPHPTKTRFGVLAIFIIGLLTLQASGQVRTWTGADSPNWSDPNNWNPIGVPQNGETLYFQGNDSNESMVNDLENLSLTEMAFGTLHEGLTYGTTDYQLDAAEWPY